MIHRYHGIIPPLVTPLRDRDMLDADGLGRLVERSVSGGVSGLFILGTTGEGPSLSYRLRREMIGQTCRLVRDRVPVLVGITDTSFVESLALARHSEECGASAVVLAPPYYLPEAQPELLEYLDHLVAELPLPLFLYNMPSLTKVTIEPETVRRAMDYERIIGLKDSSGQMIYFHKIVGLLSRRPDWALLVGPEELLADAVLAGGHGGVCGGANVFPELYVALYKSAAERNLARVRELHAQVMRLSGSLYGVGRHSSAIIKGIKCALAHLDVCDDYLAEPFHRFRDPQRSEVKEIVERLRAEIANLLDSK
jgi:dihydrodipicolinate synthase/N-acetylneuraminate lyase